jgi:hypothetical protein
VARLKAEINILHEKLSQNQAQVYVWAYVICKPELKLCVKYVEV